MSFKHPNNRFNLRWFILIIFVGFLATSCGTTKKLTRNIKPIPALKLMKQVEKNIPTYVTYSSNKMTVNLNSNDQKFTFTSQFFIDRDEKMFISLKKMAVPIGRALITPDSLYLINYYDKNYMLEDISKLQKLIGFELSYKMLQALLTADVTTIFEADVFDLELLSKVDSQMYKLETLFDINIERALEKDNERRLSRYFKYMDDEKFIRYHLWIDPDFFVTRRLKIEDIKKQQNLEIFFDKYELVGWDLFPQSITISFTSPTQNINANLKMSKPEFNKEENFNFRIPSKYKRATFKTP